MTGGCRFGSMTLGRSFTDYETDLKAQGFDEVLERKYLPLTVIDTHVHAFAAKALVVEGEMWMTVDGNTRHLQAGGTFELDPQVAHSERYGSEGAIYWVARRGGK
jgi:AraC-like ligand binding domain